MSAHPFITSQAASAAGAIRLKPQTDQNRSTVIQMLMSEHGMTALQANAALAGILRELNARGAHRKQSKAVRRAEVASLAEQGKASGD